MTQGITQSISQKPDVRSSQGEGLCFVLCQYATTPPNPGGTGNSSPF